MGLLLLLPMANKYGATHKVTRNEMERKEEEDQEGLLHPCCSAPSGTGHWSPVSPPQPRATSTGSHESEYSHVRPVSIRMNLLNSNLHSSSALVSFLPPSHGHMQRVEGGVGVPLDS